MDTTVKTRTECKCGKGRIFIVKVSSVWRAECPECGLTSEPIDKEALKKMKSTAEGLQPSPVW